MRVMICLFSPFNAHTNKQLSARSQASAHAFGHKIYKTKMSINSMKRLMKTNEQQKIAINI